MNPVSSLTELTVVANFVEVFLARENHDGAVGLNLLEKVQMPTMASLYGAMLAGVTTVVMGAGIPSQVPGILDRLSMHEAVTYRMDVKGATSGDDFVMKFDPVKTYPGSKDLKPLNRPQFLPIVSSNVLAQALMKRANGRIDGFIIEMPTAGGHNAPPRGKAIYDEKGEPVYGEKDTIDLEKFKSLGLPYWLAGGYDSPGQLKRALSQGASGVQIGTAFAFTDESGMEEPIKQKVIKETLSGGVVVKTDASVSPTGFPFKVVQMEGTLSQNDLFADRQRICDVGLLRQICKNDDGRVVYRCSAEPVDSYIAKGGDEGETIGRGCLCNNLLASAGHAQIRKNHQPELPLVTAGNGLDGIRRFIKSGKLSYSVSDVIKYILGKDS